MVNVRDVARLERAQEEVYMAMANSQSDALS